MAAAAAGVLICGGGLWWAMAGGKPAHPVAAPQVAPAREPKVAPAPIAVAAPVPAVSVVVDPAPAVEVVVPVGEPGAMSGISLSGSRVVYILDRSGCTQQAFQQMLDACYGSVQSLGQGRRFGLILWNNHQDIAFPQEDLAAASATNVEECRKLMVDTYGGSTDISSILAKAMATKPEDIVLVSAVDMDDLTVMAIRDQLAKANGAVRFHGIAVGTDLTAERLKPLVADYAGQFKQVDLTTLK